jgi:hypothetical protein
MSKHRKRYSKWPVKGVLAAMSTIVLGSLCADCVQGTQLVSGWLPGLPQLMGFSPLSFRWVSLFIIGTAFLGSFCYLYYHRQMFQSIRTLSQATLVKSRPCLIILLTKSNRNDVVFSDEPGKVSVAGNKLPEDLQLAISALDGLKWNWQQLLRGLVPHKQKLRHVYLVGSKGVADGEQGSFVELWNASSLIKLFFPEVEVDIYPAPVDFEDFEEMTECLENAIDFFKNGGVKEQEIVIDVTGGFKTASIAGAVMTMNRKTTFQYVQTLNPFEVRGYDVEFSSGVTI